ncbi:MAG: hypothetical protein IPJ60_18540 [Sphingobacteriaceae bacterium]|nr:hypothetical protein [Sphingobacteriaceae bacterium]
MAEKAKQNIIQQINLDTIDVSGKTKRIKAIPTEKFSEPLELDSSVNFGKAEELEVINEITVGENSVDHDNLNLKYSPNALYLFIRS